MKPRLDYHQAGSAAYQTMLGTENTSAAAASSPRGWSSSRRAPSQINGCAYCIDMHTKDARAAGETEQRLYGLSLARDAVLFRTRMRRARMDRSAHPDLREGHPRRTVQTGASPFQRRRDGEPLARDYHDQWLESPCDPVPPCGGATSCRAQPRGRDRRAERQCRRPIGPKDLSTQSRTIV